MKSYEVIRQAVDEPGVKAVAAALKVSPALVYKWCEPPGEAGDPDQSGTKNPLDRVREMYQLTKDIRLVRWLCNEAGGFFVANPGCRSGSRTSTRPSSPKPAAWCATSANCSTPSPSRVEDDNSIDLQEADEIRQKWEDLKAAVEGFVVACEKGHYHVKRK